MATQAKMPPDTLAASPATTPIRIAYFIDFFGGGGGTENQLAVLINGLDRTKFDPVLYTMRKVHLDNKLPVSCPVKQLDVTKLLSWQAMRAIWRFSRELRKEKFDILQIFFTDANILGVIAGKLAGIPNIIISRRDMGWWYNQKRRYITNFLNRFSHYCIANAQAIKDVVTTHEHIPSEKIEVIYNGITAPTVSYPLTKAQIGIPESAPVVGIVANLKPIKRLDRFVRVAAQIQRTDAHFLLVGYGSEEPQLTELAKQLGIADRIHFYYTADHIFAVMRLFTVGVLTSDSEGLSNALVEYALSGVPAVTFDTGGNKEAIVDGKTGFLIPAFDETEMANQIDMLLANPEKARQIGQDAIKHAQAKFSVTQMVRATEAFYTRIMGRA